jgi:anti-sigma regulatory factor (Ser/Thr protein kinase)
MSEDTHEDTHAEDSPQGDYATTPDKEKSLPVSLEERYRAFVRNSSEGIWCCELEQPISMDLSEDELLDSFYQYAYLSECNDAMARMYGLAYAEELIGARLTDMLPREVPENEAYLRGFIRSGFRLANALSVEQDYEGETRYFLNTLFAITRDRYLLRAWGTQLDITERRKVEAALETRLRYEQALSQCSRELLVQAEPRTALPHVLTALREATGVGRVYLFENFTDAQEGLCSRQTHEVCAPGVKPEIGNPELQKVPYDTLLPRWRAEFTVRQPIQGPVETFPEAERALLESQGIKSLLALPVHLGYEWYGFIGLDDVETPRVWDEQDVRLLQTVAEMLGAYLNRRRAEQALIENEANARVFVREVLASVTGGRLVLCHSADELPPRVPAEETVPVPLTSRALRELRVLTREAATIAGLDPTRTDDIVTATSEAAMNAVVHARGGAATVLASSEFDCVQIWIRDRGTGIDVRHLPRATLERGYSSKGTLGHGFWLMLQTVDRIYLLTGPTGTTVVLEQNLTPPDPLWLREAPAL